MAKRKITVWVEAETADKIEALAKLERLTLSQFCAQMLNRSVIDHADNMGWDMVGIRIEDAIRREMGKVSDRISNLLVRTSLESAASRGMLYNLIERQHGEESAKNTNSRAWNYAVSRLKTPINEVVDFLKADQKN